MAQTKKKTSKPTTPTRISATSKAPRAPATTATAPTVMESLPGQGPPDAPVAQVVAHARALANDVRALAEPLARAKVTLADATALDAQAEALELAERAWQLAWSQGAPGATAAAREALLRGRSDLFDALRVFALNDRATQATLDRIAGVESDDDLVADATLLVPLARRHASDLAGTEITPEVVDGVEAALKHFSATRAGVRGASTGETTAQALSEAARQARAARDLAFWSLAGLTRQVCLRGRFAFRHDPARASKFTGYLRAGRAAKSSSRPDVPPAPKPQG